jgi:hypothetical protein
MITLRLPCLCVSCRFGCRTCQERSILVYREMYLLRVLGAQLAVDRLVGGGGPELATGDVEDRLTRISKFRKDLPSRLSTPVRSIDPRNANANACGLFFLRRRLAGFLPPVHGMWRAATPFGYRKTSTDD